MHAGMERVQNLVRAVALPVVDQRINLAEIARSAMVLGCALALIAAGGSLPF